MKLSNETVAIMQNFSTINNSIHIDEEFKLKTKTANASNIIGIASIKEKLPELSIYSLDELLGSMSLFKQENIDYTFTNQYIKMKEGKMKINYRLSDPEHILTKCKMSDDYAAFNEFDASFELSVDQLNNIQKAARVLKADAVCFKIENGKGTISLINSQLPLDNSFELKIEGEGTAEANIFVDNLLIINSNYVVNIASDKVIKMTSKELPLFYFLAVALIS